MNQEAGKDALTLFYFCLNKPRDPLKRSWLVSGVIEAINEADARMRLNRSGDGRINDVDFDFVDLSQCPRSPQRVLAITIAHE